MMDQRHSVIKFPRRGRFAESRRQPMTEERRAQGNAWLARIRALLQEARP